MDSIKQNQKKYLKTTTLIRKCFFPLLMVLVVSLVYSNTLESPFILDDFHTIKHEPNIRFTDFSFQNLTKAGFESLSASRPIVMISFALNYYFHQNNVAGFHLVNIIIHIICGILLYHLIKTTLTISIKFSPDPLRPRTPVSSMSHVSLAAFFGAMIWLVHPVQTQSVTYIVQRMNSMAAMFYILTLLLYIKARLSIIKREKWGLFACSIITGLMAIGSKEIAATLPLFIFFYELYFFQDLKMAWFRRNLHAFAGLIIVFFLIVFLLSRGDIIDTISNTYRQFDFTMGQRVMTEFRVVIFYITLLVFPHPSRLNLVHDFPLSYSVADPITTILSMGAVTGLIALALFTAKKERLLSFSILWFLGNLVIESSIIGLHIIFEHRIYLPSMIVCMVAVISGFRYIKPKWLAVSIMCAVVTVFSVWTYERNSVWAAAITIWQDSVKKSPRNPSAHNGLGVALLEQNRDEDALRHFLEALKYSSDYVRTEAYNNLGYTLAKLGRTDEAMANYSEALRLNPYYVASHVNLSRLLVSRGELEKAVYHYKEALRRSPALTEVHMRLGEILTLQGKLKEAARHYAEALKLKPDFVMGHNNLGLVFMRMGNIQKAIICFNNALHYNPGDTDAKRNVTMALGIRNKINGAASKLQNALNLKPDDPEIHEKLVHLNRRKEELDKAIDLLQKALSTQPGYNPQDLDINNLVAVKKVKEEYDNTFIVFEKITGLHPENADAHYHKACIHARQNRTELSIEALDKAMVNGFQGINRIKTDRDLETIRGTSYYRELIGKSPCA